MTKISYTGPGVIVRQNKGSTYIADDFHSEIRSFGVIRTPASVRLLEGNGIAKCAARTLKEQLLGGATSPDFGS